ncbi:MAG TPA: hypothetical protein VFI42_17250 [Thermomicrobiaceae bacterium]|nr:hypothetical protein [Thermomicrobiaceae bacterium]
MRRSDAIVSAGIFLAIAAVGLYIVKWNPYAHKLARAAATHALGTSILSGKSAAPPAPSVHAAVSYTTTYFTSVWQALLLGLILAATIEALLPRDWLMRLLGSRSLRGTALGGVLALPGMM